MIKNLLFDFDGVIMDSNPIRTAGFRELFIDFPHEQVEELIRYHEYNGGVPRFDKIRYFYREILGRDISEEMVHEYAGKFSAIMKRELVNEKYLIDETISFIKEKRSRYNIHVVSGSEEKELQWLCRQLKINELFVSVNGSPTLKPQRVREVMEVYNCRREETVMIGDSINDREAAEENGIAFYGYNNPDMRNFADIYIESFTGFSPG